MDLERIQYKIYKLLPIIIPVALLVVAAILIIVGQHIGGRDRPGTQQDASPTLSLEEINASEALTLQEHLRVNCVLVEVTYKNNYDTATRIETYYDYMSNDFEQYQITYENDVKQYAKLNEVCKFSGLAKEVGAVLDTLPTDCKDYKFNMLDENMYEVSSLSDGYIWLAKQKETGKTLDVIKITASYFDIYFTDNDKLKRAIITDKYILVDDYIGEVPKY